ncbi:MAG: 50S ribosomal protein L24 [Defluviitaleaceae bacterium]|nr:50S ribosomal protein L24 [Defluviitaleaceae bacterium]MCL2836676.1 50S ribosomal protein L24 [Defluviitaleaceae bacterium]
MKKPIDRSEIPHMRIKRGDRVVIITGREKGAEGKILLVDRKRQRVIVEGKNMVTRHQKQNAKNPQGGLLKKEAPIHVSNVMLIHNGKPTRVGFKVERKEVNGRMVNVKYRVAKTTGEIID